MNTGLHTQFPESQARANFTVDPFCRALESILISVANALEEELAYTRYVLPAHESTCESLPRS